jgi:hypothetical protein
MTEVDGEATRERERERERECSGKNRYNLVDSKELLSYGTGELLIYEKTVGWIYQEGVTMVS